MDGGTVGEIRRLERHRRALLAESVSVAACPLRVLAVSCEQLVERSVWTNLA